MNGQAIENNWVSELGLFSVLGLPMNGQAIENNSESLVSLVLFALVPCSL
jgi:hypothetical protein